MALNLIFKSVQGEFAKAMLAKSDLVAVAATNAFRDAAGQIQRGGRAAIASAGFTRRWQSGFQVVVTPRKGASLTPRLRGFHRLGFANVFERGATIKGKPLLWIPLPAAPAKINGRRITPKLFVHSVGPLHSINHPGRPPLLAGMATKLPNPGRSVTLAQLRAGARNARRRQAARAFGGRAGGKALMVPLFIGVSSVHISKRFNISPLYDKARGELAAGYLRRLRQVNV